MPTYRPLPARPNLEYERKEAKALLRRLLAGEADALARAREREDRFATSSPADFALADAQLVIAREYGFTSWPRLVHYFEDLETQRLGRRWHRSNGLDHEEGMARSLLIEHGQRRTWAARALAAFVPRFYGMRPDEAFTITPTDAEARLAWARSHGAVSWESLLAEGPVERSLPSNAAEISQLLKTRDLDGLQRLVAATPTLLRSQDQTGVNTWNLVKGILHQERAQGHAAMKPFIDWITSEGIDLRHELSLMLCGRMKFPHEEIHWLLERGADPDWVAPNGIPLLEHVLITYWDPEGVDIIARRTTPRRALWIAAGLGDVESVARSLDAKGLPFPEAVRLRPPFDAVGAPSLASHPEPDAEELLAETLFVAAINNRIEVIAYLASRGAPLDSLVFGSTLMSIAVGNAWTDVVEVLLAGGASVDIPGWRPARTPRELAHTWLDGAPQDPARLRIRELCDLAPGPGRR